MDVIFNLSVNKFPTLSYEEKLRVKNQGRPLPAINIEVSGSSRGKTYKRQFNKDIYLRNQWICGCNRQNALFCFPCVLFGGDKAWSKTGVRDLVHLSDKIRKHENSRNHMYNQMEFNLFGKIDVQAQLDSAYWINIQKHNDTVTKNRYVLSRIINCIKFCGAFELALRGHDETESSDNPGIFRGLINFSAELDKALEEHLQNATVFKGTSKEIQNEILDCMLEVCHEEIIHEIQDAEFLAVMMDETTDVSTKFQLVTVFRYIKDGEPVERFWNFLNPPKHDAGTLSETILSVIDPLINGSTDKLIAQSYDGAGVLGGQYQGVQAKIKEKYPLAHFIHCYAHQLNSIMSKAVSQDFQVRIFFASLHEIPRFFNRSPQRMSVLGKIVGRKVPCGPSTRWNFNIRTVNVVYEHRDSLIECMKELQKEFNSTTCSQASGIMRTLDDPVFVFWLTFFHHVMPHVDVLFHQFQQRRLDSLKATHALNVFEESINVVRNKVDEIVDTASNSCATPLEVKRRRPNKSKFDNKVAAVEVCDVIIQTAKDRFAFTNHFIAANLFDADRFKDYCAKFPDEELDLTCSAYPVLNEDRLKTELSVIYSRSDLRNLRGALPFFKFLIQNNLEETMKEIKKLLEILLTIPMITAEPDRCFSTLNRIESLLRNTMGEDRLTALSMISIEKNLIKSIPNFNEKVIDKFASKKDRRINLMKK